MAPAMANENSDTWFYLTLYIRSLRTAQRTTPPDEKIDGYKTTKCAPMPRALLSDRRTLDIVPDFAIDLADSFYVLELKTIVPRFIP